MRKVEELGSTTSCLSKANEHEMLFVLRTRDPAASATVRFWIEERIPLGKNKPGDAKLIEAEVCARIMEKEQVAY